MFIDPMGLFDKDDYQLTSQHITQIFLYTITYYMEDIVKDSSIKEKAHNKAAGIRFSDGRQSNHFGLHTVSDYGGDNFNGANAVKAFIVGLDALSDRLSGWSSEALDNLITNNR